MSKNSLKRLILNLPGLNSYCDCKIPCSPIEIEHVLPKKILKKYPNFKQSENDPHNLYKCCHVLNREKGCSLLGVDYQAYDFGGMMARSCLYMNDKYKLDIDKNIIRTWNNLSLFYPPFDFEYTRSKIIEEKKGNGNKFIDNYPYFQKKD